MSSKNFSKGYLAMKVSSSLWCSGFLAKSVCSLDFKCHWNALGSIYSIFYFAMIQFFGILWSCSSSLLSSNGYLWWWLIQFIYHTMCDIFGEKNTSVLAPWHCNRPSNFTGLHWVKLSTCLKYKERKSTRKELHDNLFIYLFIYIFIPMIDFSDDKRAVKILHFIQCVNNLVYVTGRNPVSFMWDGRRLAAFLTPFSNSY